MALFAIGPGIGCLTDYTSRVDFYTAEIHGQRIRCYDGREPWHVMVSADDVHAVFGLSDDELRVPLRVEADIFIGYVYAELESVRRE